MKSIFYSETLIRKTKPTQSNQKLRDGHGLYLLIQPSGSRLWRWDYHRPTGKRNTLSFGAYPVVDLIEVRKRHMQARLLLTQGIDPGAQRKAMKAAQRTVKPNSFVMVANELLATRAKTLASKTAARDRYLLDKCLAPDLGQYLIAEINALELLAVLRKIERRRTLRTAHNARILAAQIFRYAVATGRAERNPANDLIGALPPVTKGHLASITDPKEVGALLRALWSYPNTPQIAAALKLAPLVFVRPGELRRAKWADIDLDNAQWRFITSKTGQAHIVPLATQAVAILRELQPITGHGEYVFPNIRAPQRPISDAALVAALRLIGFDSHTMTVHGFRAMARTLLDEVLGFRPDYIEHQLAHMVRDPLGRAYNRTQHLAERTRMMQVWADYLEQLRLRKRGFAAIASKFSEAKRNGYNYYA